MSKSILRQIRSIDKTRNDLQKQLIESYRNRFFQCAHCEKKTRLRSVIFVQTHWYETPYG